MNKRISLFAVLFLTVLILTGCGMRTVDEMYSIPRRSSQNISLRTAIESAMTDKTYAAPVSGENRESVQTADLDGDGKEEYLVFAKESKSDSLCILIFHQLSDELYELWESIACKGTSFEQVQYAQIDGFPGSDLIIGTRINEKVTRTALLYSFANRQSEKLKSVIYQKIQICDLNQDGISELLVIQNGEGESDNGSVRLYSYMDGSVQGSTEAKLSSAADQIRKITVNKLSDGTPAVYIVSSYGENAVVTDIMALKSDVLSNVSQYSQFGTIMPTLANHYVYAEDIDSDGFLELPGLVAMMYNATEQNLIRWFTLDENGVEENKVFTFHNFLDGWYIEVDSEWIDRFAAEKDGATYTFYMWNNSYGSAVPVFTVYTLTGKDRDVQAAAQNRFALYRGEDVVYAAKLESASAIYGITESYLESSFHLIRQDWKAAES